MSRWQEICAEYERAASELQAAQDELATLNHYAVELGWPVVHSSQAMIHALDKLLEAHRAMTLDIDSDLT